MSDFHANKNVTKLWHLAFLLKKITQGHTKKIGTVATKTKCFPSVLYKFAKTITLKLC